MTKTQVECYTPLLSAFRHKVSSVAPCVKLGILRQGDCKFKLVSKAEEPGFVSTREADVCIASSSRGYMVRLCLKQQSGGGGRRGVDDTDDGTREWGRNTTYKIKKRKGIEGDGRKRRRKGVGERGREGEV